MSVSEHPRSKRKHPPSGNPTAFDRELRQASQNKLSCRMEIAGDEKWIDVIVKYVDQYFIKVQELDDPIKGEIDRGVVGEPYWLNKSAIFKFQIGGG